MLYQVKAYRDPEGVVMLSYDATGPDEIVRKAESQGYKVISSRAKVSWGLRSRYRFPLALFSQELLSLLGAGLSLLESLETLAEKEKHDLPRKVYGQLIRLLQEGQPLSHAMKQFPDVFPSLYVATVQASEKTGDLSEALVRYLAYQQQIDIVRKRIVSAAIYPVLLMAVGSLVIVFLMAYVVPKFSRVYEDMGDNLPWMSRMLMQWGRLIEGHGAAIGLVLFLAVGAAVFWATRPATRRRVMQAMWKIPAIGERMRVYQLARFYRTLGMLLRGGIPLVTALEMVAGLLQPGLRANLEGACRKVREGQSVSESMHSQGLATEVALRMLRVGERTGKLGEMTERIASFYDDDMARWVDWFTRLFEPLLMTFIGLVIGLIVLLMYLPIFELAGNIQ
ncbi:type II secretion system protein F (GspF) [Polaromonas sp. YR568]|uniref:type II secretion system F family protein n=1 Tax=Polaromonas sp. YR568 TaxID=1855301 RepID=UPI0008E2E831|nr:type II secretion system F family protein [Polaromonas sp. YR568]SFU62354.1 type II secretion system protein F (GspF) [Polaromonas sp. YR568]